jgi:membrane-associated phospholipid phosphatase
MVAALIALAAALLCVLIVFARSRTGAVHDLDVRVADDLNGYAARHPGGVTAWKLVSDVGGPLTWRILAAGAAAVLWLLHRRRAAVVVVVTMVGAAVVSGALKTLVARHRPVVPTPVDHVGGGSFPSGHALTSFTALALLVVLTWPHARRRTRIALIVAAGALVAVIGFSRLILGVHYLTDVLGGWLIGALLVAAAAWAAREREPTPP